MRALLRKNVNTIDYDESLLMHIKDFFCDEKNDMLYVIDKEKLLGIVTRNDYVNNWHNGNVVNTEFMRIFLEKKSQDELCKEAEKIFAQYKSINELPVVNEEGILQYAYIRKGTPLDVFPYRFEELYGGDGKLARFLESMTGDEILIEADTPEILADYLEQYKCEKRIKVSRTFEKSGIDSEKLFQEYEWISFKKI